MKVASIAAAALLLVVMRAFGPDLTAQSKSVPVDCNRACLDGLMEQYLARPEAAAAFG